MTIDFHIHIFRKNDIVSHQVLQLIQRMNPVLRVTSITPEIVLEQLDAANICYGVILAQNTPKVGIHVSNEFVINFCHGQTRLLPFIHLNPLDSSNAVDQLDRAYDRGARGLTLYPTYDHFYPNNPLAYPLYERAQALRLPVMFHTGSSIFRGSKLKYGDPLHLDDVAVDFPELAIIIAHAGRGFWYDRAAFLARLHPNMYLEISGIPPHTLLQHLPDLERMADKILFGSDWPATPPIKETVQALRRLPLSQEIFFSLFEGTAAKLLRLQSTSRNVSSRQRPRRML